MAVFSQADMGAEPFGESKTWIQLTGAAVSVLLIGFIMYWGYSLIVRDVNGVPVVRALSDPMRVAPQDPGGAVADHVGLSVNAIAAEGEAAPAEDRLVLAPHTGELAPEDMAAEPHPTLPDEIAMDELPIAFSEMQPAEPLTAQQVLEMSAREGMADAGSIENAVALASSDAVQIVTEPVAPARTLVIPASVPGVAKSMRPKFRPSVFTAPAPNVAATTAVADVESALTATLVREEPLPSGTPLIQLGAFDSAEIAAREWVRLLGRYEEFLDEKERVIQKATRNGRTFYRLRAMGFYDQADARRMCSALKAENTDCVPVVIR